jgi:outer membrane biosynthesis protein TonB
MFEKIKSLLKITKFSGTITLLDGTQVIVDGSVEVGSKVYVSLPDSDEPVVLPDGEYPLEDGSIMVVTEGIISDIKPKEEPQPETEVEVETEMVEEPQPEVEVETEPQPETEEPIDPMVKINELEERLSKIEKFLTENGVMLSKIEKIETDFNSLKEKLETVDGAKKLTTKQVIVELSPVEQKLKRIKNLKE